MSWKNFACVLLASTLVFGAVGCGSQSGIGGFGTFALTSVAPNPVPGMIPTAVVITGGDFSNLVGTDVDVTFTADGGVTPFNDGSSGAQTVPGTITSATTIATTTPKATICGPTSITATIAVTMPSGVWMTSAAGFITFLAPVIASVANTGGVIAGPIFDAAVPEAATVTGANFGDVGGTVDVYWRSTPAGAGPLLFEAGSSMTTKTVGTIASATTITTTSPLALVCGAAITTLPSEIYRIDFRDGSCTPTAGPFAAATFRAPRLTAATNAGAAPYLGTTAPALFAAAIPEPYTIAGTGFGPVGGTVSIAWTSAAGTTIYNTASSATTTVTGTITSRTSIAADFSPEAAVCTVATDVQNLLITMPDGACSPSAIDGLGAATQIGPTLTQVDNIDRNLGTTSGATHPAPNSIGYFYSHIPERFQLTGTDLGPIGGTALVTMTYSNSNGFALPPTPFPSAAGPETSATIVLLGTITSRTTVEGLMPEYRMALTRGAAGIAGAGIFSHVRPIADLSFVALLEGGSCNVTPFAPAGVEVTAHVVSPGIGAAGGPPATDVVSTLRLGELEADTFTITGQGFGAPGPCEVIFEDTTAFSGFDGGAAEGNATAATIVNDTTITGRLPTITAPRLTADMLARVVVRLSNGSEAHCNQDVNFVAPPTMTTIVNSDAAAAVAPTSFQPGVTTWHGCHASVMTITGDGFLAAGPNGPTVTTIYDLNSGVGPRTAVPPLAPIRRIGTNLPAAADDLGSGTTTPAFLITPGLAGTIAGRVRLEAQLPALDTDNNGLVTMRVRVVNADGQFHETNPTAAGAPGDPVWITRMNNVDLAPSGNLRNNNDTAIDPSSILAADNFATATELAALDNANMTVVSGDAPNGGLVLFDGTGLSVQYTRDGGTSWVDASAAWTGAVLSGPDGAPAGAFRNFAQCEYDTYGNLHVSYLVDDVVGGTSTVAMAVSLDQGATPAAVVLSTSTPALFFGPGVLSEPSLAVGPTATGTNQGIVAWIDRTGFGGDVVRVMGFETSGFGIVGPFFAPLTLPDPPPAGFTRLDAEVAIGPGGQTYVGWVEPNFFVGPPFTSDILVSNDADGLGGATFGFPAAATIADTVLLAAAGIPASPDFPSLGPNIDMAVALAGTNSGRLVVTYEDVIPADFILTFADRYQVVTKHSDDDGATWPLSRTIVHDVNNVDQFMPAIANDATTGRFYVTWYDTRFGGVGPVPGYDRFSAASDQGTTWGSALRLSNVTAAQAADFDTDYGFWAGLSAYGGCVLAAWTNVPAGGNQDPRSVTYQQDAKSSP